METGTEKKPRASTSGTAQVHLMEDELDDNNHDSEIAEMETLLADLAENNEEIEDDA